MFTTSPDAPATQQTERSIYGRPSSCKTLRFSSVGLPVPGA